jgi:hypothetical protein
VRVLPFQLLLLIKLSAVLAFAGGAFASVLSSSVAEQKRAVHTVASPALVVIWISGYLLAQRLGAPLMELWLLSGGVLSIAALLGLMVAVHRGRRGWFALTGVSLLVVLAMMIFRPTWGHG